MFSASNKMFCIPKKYLAICLNLDFSIACSRMLMISMEAVASNVFRFDFIWLRYIPRRSQLDLIHFLLQWLHLQMECIDVGVFFGPGIDGFGVQCECLQKFLNVLGTQEKAKMLSNKSAISMSAQQTATDGRLTHLSVFPWLHVAIAEPHQIHHFCSQFIT